eukprot:TRINITY_DN8016_c0_g2_i2.p1 TRINITY_DN8016_c0_g2~~TRINITY_DN8016_c0_g2_i2.p1  ORF type:complete len:479 (+),score=120.11 TRINITY_DN8016_c0_g2_i2:141-1577(+)
MCIRDSDSIRMRGRCRVGILCVLGWLGTAFLFRGLLSSALYAPPVSVFSLWGTQLPSTLKLQAIFQPPLVITLRDSRTDHIFYQLRMAKDALTQSCSPITSRAVDSCTRRQSEHLDAHALGLSVGASLQVELRFIADAPQWRGRTFAHRDYYEVHASINQHALPRFASLHLATALARADQLLVEAPAPVAPRASLQHWRNAAEAVPPSIQAAAPEVVRALFVGILSGAGLKHRRDALRASWLLHPVFTQPAGGAVARFVLGQTGNRTLDRLVLAEAAEHGDMLVVPGMADGYWGIANKTLAILRHGALLGARWTFKTDDDAFVQVSQLLLWLDSLPQRPAHVYAGNLECFVLAERGAARYAMPVQAWGFETYLPMAHGPGYAVSLGLAAHIALQQGLPVLPLEDVSMSVWVELAKEQGLAVQTMHTSRIMYGNGQCEQDSIVVHYMGPTAQLCAWGRAQGGRDVCGCQGAAHSLYKDV